LSVTFSSGSSRSAWKPFIDISVSSEVVPQRSSGSIFPQ
jgi:hypothetical protein